MVNISDTKSMRAKVADGPLALLLIDLQERLAPAIAESPEVIDRALSLVESAGRAGMPVLATEQYSKGLGQTVPRLRRRLDPDRILEKTAFAAPRERLFRERVAAHGLKEFVVAGTEAHVCVLQTVLCLLAQGRRVTLVSDAVASREPMNKAIALRRMAAAGAVLTTTEEAIGRFEALAEAERPRDQKAAGQRGRGGGLGRAP